MARASSIQTLADWVVNNKLRADLLNEAELLGQYTQQFGWSVAHIGWERRLGIRPVSITLADLEQRAMSGDVIAGEAVSSIKSTGTNLTLLLAFVPSEILVGQAGVLDFAMTDSDSTKFTQAIKSVRCITYIDCILRHDIGVGIVDQLVNL